MNVQPQSLSISTLDDKLKQHQYPSAIIGGIICAVRQCEGHSEDSEIQAIKSVAKLLEETDPIENEKTKKLFSTIREWKAYDSLPFSVRARLRIAETNKTQRSLWKSLGIWLSEIGSSLARVFSSDLRTTNAFLAQVLKNEVLLVDACTTTKREAATDFINNFSKDLSPKASVIHSLFFSPDEKMLKPLVHEVLETSHKKFLSSKMENPKPTEEPPKPAAKPPKADLVAEDVSSLPSFSPQENLNLLKTLHINTALKKIGDQTRKLYTEGAYQTEGVLVHLDRELMKQTQQKTKVFQPNEPPVIAPEKHIKGLTTTITIDPTDTVTATIHVKERGAKNPVLLNLANAFTPGGGFITGCTAQEEELCRCSTLFHAIGENQNLAGSKKPEKNPTYKKPIPVGGNIYSPQVQFFRGTRSEGYPLWKDPLQFGVISAAGFDLRKNPSYPNGDEYREVTIATIENILRVAAANGHDAVVLGAIGCGAFRDQDWEQKNLEDGQTVPQLVSKLFKEVLDSDEFKGVFKEVSFGIFDKESGQPVLRAFQLEFGQNLVNFCEVPPE